MLGVIRTVGTEGSRGRGHVPPNRSPLPIIFSDGNVPFFKSYASFSNLILFHSFVSFVSCLLALLFRKLMTSTNILIYNFTVSGLLKIMLICSVSFNRFSPISAPHQPFNLLFLVGGMSLITQTEILCPLRCTEKIFSVIGEGKIFSSRNDHKIFTNARFVWCLKSGFSSVYSPSHFQNLLALKHSR